METQLDWNAESFIYDAGYDDEENWLDVGTVKGYKRVVMCQEVREEIRTVLGEQTCIKDFLQAMCDDRLLPTPWLNKVRMLANLLRPWACVNCEQHGMRLHLTTS